MRTRVAALGLTLLLFPGCSGSDGASDPDKQDDDGTRCLSGVPTHAQLAGSEPLLTLAELAGKETLDVEVPAAAASHARTINDLARFGEKRGGTAAGHAAAQYIRKRLEVAGVDEIRGETYEFPDHVVTNHSIAVGNAGALSPMAAEDYAIFDGSGNGSVEHASLLWVKDAKDEAIEAALRDAKLTDLTGKVALLERNSTFHRSAQYKNLVKFGAAAMLYVSAAEDRMIQVGTIRDTWEAMGPIPAVTIDRERGEALRKQLEAGQDIRATINVGAEVAKATGENVVGVIHGKEPGQIILGAHYDTWFYGGVDNVAGVAIMLALAEEYGHRISAGGDRPQYDLVFVAYDGEETGLYGGYDYLRKHQHEDATKKIVAVYNFEVPASIDAGVKRGMAGSGSTVDLTNLNRFGVADGIDRLNEILEEVGLVPVIDFDIDTLAFKTLYRLFVSLALVNEQLGIIATDIQGWYRSGFYTVSTAVQSKWYHTIEDTPDKVDTRFLARATDAFACAVDRVGGLTLDELEGTAHELWTAEISTTTEAANIRMSIRITDSDGDPQEGAWVELPLFCSDYYRVAQPEGVTDRDGRIEFVVPADLSHAIDSELIAFPQGQQDCSTGRYYHMLAGPFEAAGLLGLDTSQDRSYARIEVAGDWPAN